MATPHAAQPQPSRPPSIVSGLLYGLGFGGFIDGILLHQILQWHHLVSHVQDYPVTTVAGLEVNTTCSSASTTSATIWERRCRGTSASSTGGPPRPRPGRRSPS
jgi:hypothetical protein